MNLTVLLWGIPQAMRAAAKIYPAYAARLKERNLIAQFRLRDRPEGRWIQLRDGKVTTGKGLHAKPDLTLYFKNRQIAESFLTPPFDLLERVDAAAHGLGGGPHRSGPHDRAGHDARADRGLHVVTQNAAQELLARSLVRRVRRGLGENLAVGVEEV